MTGVGSPEEACMNPRGRAPYADWPEIDDHEFVFKWDVSRLLVEVAQLAMIRELRLQIMT